jgi:hypothetical protein
MHRRRSTGCPCMIFMCSSGGGFETGLALLSRCRAERAPTPDFHRSLSPRRARMGMIPNRRSASAKSGTRFSEKIMPKQKIGHLGHRRSDGLPDGKGPPACLDYCVSAGRSRPELRLDLSSIATAAAASDLIDAVTNSASTPTANASTPGWSIVAWTATIPGTALYSSAATAATSSRRCWRRSRATTRPWHVAMPLTWSPCETRLDALRNLPMSRSEKSWWTAGRNARPRFGWSFGSTPRHPCGSIACKQANSASRGRGCRPGTSGACLLSNRTATRPCAGRRATARRSASLPPARPIATPSPRPRAGDTTCR